METTETMRPRAREALQPEVAPIAPRQARPAPVARSAEADVVRVAAMYAVVLLHAAAPAVARVSTSGTSWHVANLFDSLARPAVPLFLMLTGALALHESTARDPWRFVRRRALSFWIPALAWMVAYSVWDAVRDGKPWGGAASLRALARGTAHYHLWYVWVAGALLLALPILARWWVAAREGERRYALAAWGALSVIAPWAGRLWLGGPTKLDPLVVGGWVGFPLLGAWLASREWDRRSRRLLQLLGVVGFVITVGGTAALRNATLARATRAPRFDDRFYGYLTPNVVVMAIAWWVTLVPAGLPGRRRAVTAPAPARAWVAWVADASYPVYLAHPLVLEGMARAAPGARPTLADPRFAPIVAAGAVVVSLTFVAAASRAPVIRHLFPVATRRPPRRAAPG